MSRYHLRQILSILLLPGIVTVLIPGLILWRTGWGHPDWGLAFPWAVAPGLLGFLFLLAGLSLMARTIALFITVGKGTLAPWDATQKLVVQGPYRYVRNPMITGVFAILLGEAIWSGSWPVLVWFAIAVLLNVIYIPRSEEPGMLKRFGEDYREYQQHVPRWIPRLKPWTPPQESKQ